MALDLGSPMLLGASVPRAGLFTPWTGQQRLEVSPSGSVGLKSCDLCGMWLETKILPTPGTWAFIHFQNVRVYTIVVILEVTQAWGELEKGGGDSGLPFPLQVMHLRRTSILPWSWELGTPWVRLSFLTTLGWILQSSSWMVGIKTSSFFKKNWVELVS